MAQRYIDREGIPEQETPKLIKADEITRFRQENQLLKEDIVHLRERYDSLSELVEQVNQVMKPLLGQPEALKILAKKGALDSHVVQRIKEV